jgi:nucleotide-binding universal stress UspA family protein
MLPFNRILWPTDFSRASYEALQTAKGLAAHFGSELVLLHVVPPIAIIPSPAPSRFYGPAYQRAAKTHALHALQEVTAEKVPGSIKMRADVLIGPAAKAIVDYSAKEEADLIVIATYGETGIERFLFGSVAEKVVRLASCPVLTVRPPWKEE